MAAAGMADGAYRLGSLTVDVVDGVAKVAGTDTIAGSTATMDHVFRYAVENSGLPRDDALLAAVRQSSVNPARALGLPDGGLKVGACRRPGRPGRRAGRDRSAAKRFVGYQGLAPKGEPGPAPSYSVGLIRPAQSRTQHAPDLSTPPVRGALALWFASVPAGPPRSASRQVARENGSVPQVGMPANGGGAPMTFVKQRQRVVGRRACCLGAWRRGRRCGGGRGR